MRQPKPFTAWEIPGGDGGVKCRCGMPARGGVLLNGLASCCVGPNDRALLEGMIGDAPEPVEIFQPLVAADPFSVGPGVHPAAAKVLWRIRDGLSAGHRQASGEAVAEALAQGPVSAPSEDLRAPSIPPRGGPDPLFADVRPPLRSARMARANRGGA